MLKTFTIIGLIDTIVRRTCAESSLEAYPALSRTTPECCQPSTEVETRNYYDGYRGTAVASYYPGFDPLSIMASLAFLAFLFQSLVSLFDRSRSVAPAISRQFTELKTITEILDALDKRANDQSL